MTSAKPARRVVPVTPQTNELDRARGCRCKSAVSPSRWDSGREPLILEELLSLKIIGMPDAVNTSTAPSVERFRENQLPALPGQMAAGSLALPVATSS